VIPKTVKVVAEKSESGLSQGTVSLSGKQIEIRPSAEKPPQTIPLEKTGRVVDKAAFDRTFKSPGILGGWTADVTLGASLVDATQNLNSLTSDINLVREVPTVEWRTPSNRTSLNMSASYSWSKSLRAAEPRVKTTIYEGTAERDQFIIPRLYAFAQVALDHNYSQNLELAQSYMGGLGWVVFRAPHQRFDLKASGGYIQRGYYNSLFNKNLSGSIFAENYRYKVEDGIEFHEELSFIPAWSDSNAYAAAGKAGISLPISDSFSVDVSARDSYLNGVPLTYRKNSFQFTTGLTYEIP
jgi:hypothetical protein